MPMKINDFTAYQKILSTVYKDPTTILPLNS